MKKRKWHAIAFLALVLLLSSLIVACGPAATSTPTAETPPATEDRSERPPETDPQEEAPAPEETPSTEPTPGPVPTDGELSVHFIDVGQGDSILVDLGETEILIDGGGKSPGVVRYLNDYVDGPLDAMVATHPHADHIGGLIAVLGAFDVEQIWLNGDSSSSQTFGQFMDRVDGEGASVHEAQRGHSIEVGTLTFHVLHPARPLLHDTNNNSIVLRLTYGSVDFLFTGDAEKEAEAGILGSGLTVQADILKVGHHCSRTSSSQQFLDSVQPKIAVYMAGQGNSYGHPHQETLAALAGVGAEVYGTDLHGTITVVTDGEGYTLQLDNQALPSTPSTGSPTATPTPEPTPSPPPEPEPTGTGSVRITKIFYDGLVPRSESDEYVEVTNLGSEPQDLSGWVLKDIDEGYPSITFPSYTLAPGASIRVYTNEIHPESGGFSFGYGKAAWNNKDPDTAALYTAQGQEVSRKSY